MVIFCVGRFGGAGDRPSWQGSECGQRSTPKVSKGVRLSRLAEWLAMDETGLVTPRFLATTGDFGVG